MTILKTKYFFVVAISLLTSVFTGSLYRINREPGPDCRKGTISAALEKVPVHGGSGDTSGNTSLNTGRTDAA